MKVATGTKEENGAQQVRSGSGLRLVPNADAPKKIYKIGVCEKIFSPQQEVLTKLGNGNPDGDDSAAAQRDGTSSFGRREKVVSYVGLGLVVGYLVGRLTR